MSSATPTWLITGTSNGFGLALARHVVSMSHNLISISRHPSPHDSLTAIVTASPGPKPILHHIPLDLADPNPGNLKSAVTNFLSTHPQIIIDVVINNAAITAFGPLETLSHDTLSRVMTVNFYSPLWLIQSVLPCMRTSKNGIPKTIVNTSSTQGLTSDPAETAYEASKHALEGMSGVLAKEIYDFGIRVLVVNLGSFRTGFALGDSALRSQSQAGIESNASSDPYADPAHPVRKRIEMVTKYANIPDAARGDTEKGAKVVFDVVMKTEGSEVNKALQRQRSAIERGGREAISMVERLILGSDAQPKIKKQADWFAMQVESCRVASGLADADGVNQLGG